MKGPPYPSSRPSRLVARPRRSKDGPNGTAQDKHTMKRTNCMTSQYRRVLSAWVTLTGSPDTTPTASLLARRVALCSTDSVRPHCGTHHRSPEFENRRTVMVSMMCVLRSTRRGQQHDSAATRPTLLALRNTDGSGRHIHPASRGEVTGTILPFPCVIAPQGRNGHGPVDQAL